MNSTSEHALLSADSRNWLGDKGGSRVLPMPDLSAITVAQADALVAQLAAG